MLGAPLFPRNDGPLVCARSVPTFFVSPCVLHVGDLPSATTRKFRNGEFTIGKDAMRSIEATKANHSQKLNKDDGGP